jgi:IS30 family transposase
MSYTQLSLPERIRLHHLRYTEHLSISETATRMECSQNTISRELKRNRFGQTLYLPDSAHQKMQTRRQQSKQPFMSVSLSAIKQLKQRLDNYHSPEQICGRLKREGLAKLSHETVYQMIYANHQGLGAYQRYLRQGHKQRHHRKGIKAKRGIILGRVGIEHRSVIADLKHEIGHW